MHYQLHDIDDDTQHNGVSGVAEGEFMTADANGLPAGSGITGETGVAGGSGVNLTPYAAEPVGLAVNSLVIGIDGGTPTIYFNYAGSLYKQAMTLVP